MVFCPADNVDMVFVIVVNILMIHLYRIFISMCLLTSKIDPERFRHVPIIIPSRTWKQCKAVIKIIYIYTIVP